MPVPEPGPGQVLVKVGGAGACHSDLHLMEAPPERLGPALPFTLGHENAGWVEKLGPGATGFAPGDPVIVYGPWGCGLCANCRLGMENYCENHGRPRWRAGRERRGHGSVPARPVDALPDSAGVPRSPRGRPAQRRRAHQLPRRQAVAPPARGGLDRRGDRGGRPRPDGHPDPARAQRGDDRRRRGHRGRQARDRQAHGRGRGAALGRRGGHAHQGHDARTGRRSSCSTWSA